MPQLPMNPMNMNMQQQYPMSRTIPITQNKGWGQRAYEGAFGSPDEIQQTALFNPQQQQSLMQLLSMGFGGLQQTPFSFQPIADQARTQFAQRTIPSIAERFTALGGQRSSGFNNALNSEASEFEGNLAALGGQYNLAQQGNLLKLLGLGLQPQYENSYRQGTNGILGGIGQAAGYGSGIGLRALLGF